MNTKPWEEWTPLREIRLAEWAVFWFIWLSVFFVFLGFVGRSPA